MAIVSFCFVCILSLAVFGPCNGLPKDIGSADSSLGTVANFIQNIVNMIKNTNKMTEKIMNKIELTQRALSYNTRKECPRYWKQDGVNCFYLSSTWRYNWRQAQEACERYDAHLVILDNKEKNDFISQFLNQIGNETSLNLDSVWIGGFSFRGNGNWMWVNGQLVDYTNWKVVPTDEDLSREKGCMEWSDGWKSNRCDQRLHFICEKAAE